MGKSRLALEWLRKLPAHWFGYFAKKNADAVCDFQPFTDTVVIFDYVLGQEQPCAETIAAYLELSLIHIYLYCYRINGYSRWYLIECVAIEAAKFLLG